MMPSGRCSPSLAWLVAGIVVGLSLANEAVVVLAGPGFMYVTVRAIATPLGVLAHLLLVGWMLTRTGSAGAKLLTAASLVPTLSILAASWLYPFALFRPPHG